MIWLTAFLCAVIILLLLIIMFMVAYQHEIAASAAKTALRKIVLDHEQHSYDHLEPWNRQGR